MERLIICIQNSDGRMGRDSLDLLAAADFQFQAEARVDICDVTNFPLSIEFSRNMDIPDDVQRGFCDFGIVGQDRIAESGTQVIPLLPLGFGKCRLQLGVRSDIPYTNPKDLQNLRVATSFPNLSRTFFRTSGILVDLIIRAGKVEKYVKQGRTEACIDITSSGKSMKRNGIEPYDILLESEAFLIASPTLKQKRGNERLVEEFLISIVSAIRSRNFTYLTMNAPDLSKLAILERLPSEESPTVSSLEKLGWLAISSIVPRNNLRATREALQEAGARDIIETPLRQIAPNRDDRVIIEMMEKIYG